MNSLLKLPFATIFILLSFVICFSLPHDSTSSHNPYNDNPINQALFDTIALQDSLLFVAFNSRDLESMKTFFSTDLEVYQDNVGVRTYDETIAAFGELFQKDYLLTRVLVAESLEVYPIKDFGAIETGRHTFSHIENGKLEAATFKFVHIWEEKDGHWKIVRLITYDHY